MRLFFRDFAFNTLAFHFFEIMNCERPAPSDSRIWLLIFLNFIYLIFINWASYLVEWIPKWQNKIDTWFSGRLFSKMARKSWIFHINHNRKLCMGQKWQKLQIQDLLSKVCPKGQIFKMTLFSSIDLDKIRPKKLKLMKLS